MKSPLFSTLAVAALLGLPGALAAQDTFLFDFGGTATQMGPVPDDPTNFWNNLDNATGTSDTGVLPDLQNISGDIVTGMNLEMVRRFNGTNQSGSQTSALFPATATGDSLYGNTELFSGQENIFPAFKLTGLDTSLSYDFTIYASRLGVSDNRETQYTITGANSQVLLFDPANNDTDQTILATGVTPDASGEILIELEPGPANDNGNHFTYLGVLRIQAGVSTGDVAIQDDPESITVTEYEPATFRVSVTGAGPFMVKWKKDGADIPDATDFAYAIPEATLDLDGASYTVSVSNGTSSATSDAAILTVEADMILPTALATGVVGANAIAVSFSEPLDAVTGSAVSSYAVSDKSGSATVTSATLNDDRTEVQLVLNRPLGGTFTVSVAGVTDRAGNMVDATMNTVSGSAAAAGTVTYLVDFGGGTTPSDPLNTWNLLSTGTGQDDLGILENIFATNGDESAISIAMIARFNGVNTAGATTSNLFPVEATSDSLYGNSEDWGGLIDVFPSFKLTGLDSNNSHSLTFYAARLGAGDNRETRYTVTGRDGEAIALFNPANNSTDEFVKIEGIYPDEAGEITITLTPGDNNDNANHFTYLNVLRIDVEPGSSQALRITDYDLDQATNVMSLSWIAIPNQIYSVYRTDDLTDLQEDGDVADAITDNGADDLDPEPGRIRFEFSHPDPAKPKQFFTVYRN